MRSRIAERRVARGLAWLLLAAAACQNYDVPRDPEGMFAPCCDGLGACVARGVIEPDQRSRLGQDSCERRLLCAPVELVLAGSQAPSACRTRATRAEGRCLPECLPDIAAQPGLRRDGCPEGRRCAPCFDPFSGERSGACELGLDRGPTRPKVTFDSCCGSLGRCVPSELIAPDDRARLSPDECDDGRSLCVPEPLARASDWTPRACHDTDSGAEGRCLPACLPDVAQRAGELSRADCPAEHLCAPCTDPVTAESTGACTLGGDPGPSEPPVVFASCCDSLGRCVPERLVAEENRAQLARDSCEHAEDLCVPELLARAADARFMHCEVSTTHAEGRCLPACLPAIRARADALAQDGCPTGHVCGPCFDPLDGSETGACSLGGDPGPERPPTLFARCCAELGLCLPSELVSADERDRLSRDACADASTLCVPEPLARDPSYDFSACVIGHTGAEGRCLPACLPDVAARADQLARADCGASELCTPCFEPLEGTATGACSLGGDPGPSSSPVLYAACCSEAGRCIPGEHVPAELRDQLSANECTGSGAPLCVPLTLARDASEAPARCHDSETGAEGRCLMQCLPAVEARATGLRASGCGPAELCVPCYDPLSGDDTGACGGFPGDPGPSEPPVVFEDCCSGSGACVPAVLLPGDDASALPAQSCSKDGYVCAPRVLLSDPNDSLPRCISVLGPSVCVESCFVPEAISGLLSASGCAEQERCVPCWAANGLCP